jgi:hypothetical protein
MGVLPLRSTDDETLRIPAGSSVRFVCPLDMYSVLGAIKCLDQNSVFDA